MTQPTSNYTVAYGYSQSFQLTEVEAKALVRAAEEGAKICKFKDRVFSTNFSWLVPNSELEQVELSKNPVLNDPDFRRWKLEHSGRAAERLDRKYPTEKYQAAWDEANDNVDYLKSIVPVEEDVNWAA